LHVTLGRSVASSRPERGSPDREDLCDVTLLLPWVCARVLRVPPFSVLAVETMTSHRKPARMEQEVAARKLAAPVAAMPRVVPAVRRVAAIRQAVRAREAALRLPRAAAAPTALAAPAEQVEQATLPETPVRPAKPEAARSSPRARTSLGTIPSATSSCGQTCSGCTRSFRTRYHRSPRSRLASR